MRVPLLPLLFLVSLPGAALAQPQGPQADAHKMVPFGANAPKGPTGLLATALQAANTSDYARAEAALSGIIGSDGPAAQLALARVYEEQGKIADAERLASHVRGDADIQGLALALRARLLFHSGKQAEAVKLLESVKDHGGRGGRAIRLALGEFRIATGHRQDADAPLHAIIDDYNNDAITSADAEGLAVAGRAAELLRSPKDANKLFNLSERADPNFVDGLLWHSQLFLETYDPGHAEETINQARKIAPKRPDLAVHLARVKLEQTLDFDAADELTKEALKVNPKLVPAYAVRAAVALRDGDLALAEKEVESGLAIDPNDVELLTLHATARYLADDHAGFEQAKKEVFARNPEFSGFYVRVGDFAEWEHRYSDIIEMMKEAVKLDPDDAKAYAQLGLTLMRDGNEQAGMDALREAWKKDHFNVRVFNTLNLYEQTISTAYDLQQQGIFNLRYPKDEEKVLERYVPVLLGEAWGSMKGRYGFVPETPVQVELYSNREQFSVRTSGLPNIGIEGVCFGHVLAAMSPKSESFNWGNVVWHELGHVFAIQLSKSHVPRWFTEGLSEYETITRRPEWHRELDPQLYQALVSGRLPGAVQMNRAFTHATDGEDMTVAYYASSQMVVFTAERFGMPKIVEALKLWGEGKTTPEVISGAFGVSPDEYDREYRAWERQKLTRYDGQFMLDEHPPSVEEAKAKVDASPKDAGAHSRLALALLRDRKRDDAKQEIDRALSLDAKEPSALYLSARFALAAKEFGLAQMWLGQLSKANVFGFQIEMAKAELAHVTKDKVAQRSALEAAARLDPSQSAPLQGLLELAEEDKRGDDALGYLEKLALLDQHDRKTWRTLLERLVDKGRWEEAVKVGEGAIYVDVESARVHTAYGKALSAVGDHAKAAFELESATYCSAPPKELAVAYALLAKEKLARGDAPGARQAKDSALRLDPANADARALVIP